ncbi:hypothetical protein [Streptomyces sp. 900105245]
MAKRKVRRRARKILGADPTALVWCELARPIPAPPEQVHRAAGSKRLTPGRHWLLYAGAVLFFFVVIPMMLIDKLGDRLERRPAGPPRTPATSRTRPQPQLQGQSRLMPRPRPGPRHPAGTAGAGVARAIPRTASSTATGSAPRAGCCCTGTGTPPTPSAW